MARALLAAALLSLLVSTALAAPPPPRVRTRGGGRIVGGEVADVANYPWMVSVQNNGAHYCGGSLISDTWVLTACHCVHDNQMRFFSIRAGTSVRESGGAVSAVESGLMNSWFDPGSLDYDITVLKAASPLPIGGNIQLVGLPADGYDPPGGLPVTITGWGSPGYGGASPVTLMKVDISIIDRASCVTRFGITDRMICAGEAGRSTCYGDSGGPLVSGNMQVGIVSWGRTECETDGGVYSNVGNLRSWITGATGI